MYMNATDVSSVSLMGITKFPFLRVASDKLEVFLKDDIYFPLPYSKTMSTLYSHLIFISLFPSSG